MTPERLAEIRDLYSDALEGFECCGKHVIEAFGETLAEVDRLRRWKSGATEVLAEWENVWAAADEPGRLGESKAKATAAEVDRLLAQVKAVRQLATVAQQERVPVPADLILDRLASGDDRDD